MRAGPASTTRFRLTDGWEQHLVGLRREELAEGDDDLVVSTVAVRHASDPDHLTYHEQWLCDNALEGVRSGADLWRLREELFPNLRLLPRVEDDLTDMEPATVYVVAHRLMDLDRATATWDPANSPQPVWPCKVTPEHEQRKRLCWFDADGQQRLFDLHARYTTAAGHGIQGRVHLDPEPASRQVIVAHVGGKLGV